MKLLKNPIFIASLIIVTGCLTSFLIVSLANEEEMTIIETSPFAVQTRKFQRTNYQLEIPAWGFVEPLETIEICPEISGRVTEVSEKLHVGRRVVAGEFLFAIDDRKFIHTLAEAEGATVLAEQELEIEMGRQIIARKEWDLLENSAVKNESNMPLALRGPHLKAKEASLQIALAQQAMSVLDVERTKLEAPCDGLILSDTIALGQFLEVGDAAVTIGCTRSYLINARFSQEYQLSPDHRIVPITFPENTLMGEIRSALPFIEPDTRQKRVLVSFASTDISIGQHASLKLPGTLHQKVIVLPKSVVRKDQTVWLLSDRSTLEVRKIKIIAEDKNFVIIDEGISEEDRVITSHIACPLVGMRLAESPAEPSADWREQP